MDEDDYRQALAKLDSLEQHDTTSLSSRRLDEGMIPMVWLQTEDEVSVEVPVRVGLTRHGVQVLVTETFMLCLVLDGVPVLRGILFQPIVRHLLEWSFQTQRQRRVLELNFVKQVSGLWPRLFTTTNAPHEAIPPSQPLSQTTPPRIQPIGPVMPPKPSGPQHSEQELERRLATLDFSQPVFATTTKAEEDMEMVITEKNMTDRLLDKVRDEELAIVHRMLARTT